jgi:uncharacterized repeat protein (TIGR03803 family)
MKCATWFRSHEALNAPEMEVGAMDLWMTVAAISIAILLILVATQVQAQTGTVLHNFTGGADGAIPLLPASPSISKAGSTARPVGGGSHGQGVVYRLVREGDGWVFSPIYSFGSQEHDGSNPQARVLFGPNGLLYGTTYQGGAEGYGTVFSLQPPATACKSALCPWVETVLYSFTGGADGAYPGYGRLGLRPGRQHLRNHRFRRKRHRLRSFGCGVVFKLTRSGSGWTESVLWNFTGGNDGSVSS